MKFIKLLPIIILFSCKDKAENINTIETTAENIPSYDTIPVDSFSVGAKASNVLPKRPDTIPTIKKDSINKDREKTKPKKDSLKNR